MFYKLVNGPVQTQIITMETLVSSELSSWTPMKQQTDFFNHELAKTQRGRRELQHLLSEQCGSVTKSYIRAAVNDTNKTEFNQNIFISTKRKKIKQEPSNTGFSQATKYPKISRFSAFSSN